MAIVILLIIKIIFFASLAGIIYMLFSKIGQVKALPEAATIERGGLVLPINLKKIKDISLAAPGKARELLRKEKEAMIKQLKAIKFFSEQKIVYRFRAPKASQEKPVNKPAEPLGDQQVFEDDYWHKVNKQ
jgi:hypothetical protein